jgi:hypothetical protein
MEFIDWITTNVLPDIRADDYAFYIVILSIGIPGLILLSKGLKKKKESLKVSKEELEVSKEELEVSKGILKELQRRE